MGKRFWSLVLSMALIGGVFSALPARAQEAPAPAVPATPNIVDPAGDANFLNSGTAGPLGQDTTTPADASTIGDLLAVWFSHTADSVSVHWQTEAVPPGGNGVGYQAFASPGEGTAGANAVGCLRFTLNIPGTNPGGGTYQDTEWVRLLDRCNVGTSNYENAIDGTYTIHEGPNATGIMTATFPRSYSPLLADGQTLSIPTASANSPLIGSHTNGAYVTPTTDNTKPGTDYVLSAAVSGGAGNPSAPTEPPGKNDPPGKGKKKGCPKGKGQKKGACPKPKPAASCVPYTPGEDGAEAESSVITDAATEEKPVVVEYEAEMGGPSSPVAGTFDLRSFLFHNIQVDSASPDTGLYVKTEFTENHDYDLALFHADGSEAASSGESQPEPGLGAGSPEGAWEGGSNYEFLKGIRTTDCAGYTARVAGYLTTGGPVTISMWLGPVVGDPAAPGGGAAVAADGDSDALTSFYSLTGLANPSVKVAQASSTPAADKGCKRGKGKKNGCQKPPVSCAPYTPGELGAEAPLVTVTDANTADAPVLVPITLDPAADEGVLEAVGAGETPRAYFNVQVDSASASTGLYATFEFQSHRDYDFWAYNPDGSAAASSHGFQPLIDTKGTPADESNTASNHAGESTATSENIVGLITPDCGGYTFEASNYLGEGGDFEIKVWLGEGTTAPGVPE